MSIGLNSPAPTTSFIVGGIYNPVAPNPAPGQAVAFQLDANGNVLVNIAAGAASGVQYVDGVTQATPTGTVALGKNAANVIHAFTLDTFGNLNVNLAAGSISGGNAAAAPTGAAVPVSADYAGVNISGNLVGVTGLALGATTKAPTIAIVDGSGNQITSFGGGIQFADNAGSGATPTGTLSMGWDSANSKIRALKVDASQDLFVAFSSAQHVVVDNASIAVTGTFFQATQPVSIAAAVDVSDRVARLLGHVTVDNASIAVTGTFFQATQPVSIAAAVDVSDRVARLLGHVTVDNASLAVTGTFFQATQPVSIAAAVDVSDRTARLLGHVTVDNASLAVTGTFFQATQPVSIAAAVDVSDRVGRLLGHVTVDNASLPVTQSGAWAVSVSNFPVTQVVLGNKSHNSAVPTNDNVGALVGLANAVAPTYSEGDQVLLSADLSGNLRVAATVTPSALQNVNLTQVGSTAFSIGQQPQATSISVALANESFGVLSGQSDKQSQMMVVLEAMRRALVALACEGGRNKPQDFDPNIISQEEGADDWAD